MKKSIINRFRITKNGKLMRRKMAQGHFRAGKSGNAIRSKRDSTTASKADEKSIKSYGVRLG